jgi:apolipoprotein N-acyltransferase
MVANYLEVSLATGWVSLFVVSVGLAGIYFSAFAAWLSWLVRRQAANPFLVAAGWGVCEFARANLLIGNPWVLSGYSQVSLTWFVQLVDVTGPYGLGILIAAVNACGAACVIPALRGRQFPLSCVNACLVIGATLLYGEWRLSQSFGTGKPIQIALVQGAIEQKFRWNPSYSVVNLQRYLDLTKQATATHPAIVFWPENAVDFPLDQNMAISKMVLRTAKDLKTDLILGGPYYRYDLAQIHYRNSVFLVRRGAVMGRYDKLRLIPLAEDHAFASFLPRKYERYEPGQQVQTLHAGDVQVGAFLCFEALYPDFVRSIARQGAEVLTNPSNDDWFGDPAPAQHMLDAATVRAIENRRYLVRPTASGFSAVIDPHGRRIVLSEFGRPEVLATTIQRATSRTFYQRWGDVVAWLSLAFVGVTSFWRGCWSNSHREGGTVL